MESDNYDIFSKGRGEWKTNNKGKMNFKDNSRVQAILEKKELQRKNQRKRDGIKSPPKNTIVHSTRCNYY